MQLLGELIAVRYVPVKAAVLLPDWQRTLIGTVLAVGPGRPLIDGGAAPMKTQPGDVVVFGAAVGMESVYNGEAIRILRDSEVDLVVGTDFDAALGAALDSASTAAHELPPHLARINRLVRPLRDRLLIKRFEYQHPVLWTTGISLQKGLVVATGPGRRQRRKVRFDLMQGHLNTERSLYFEDGDETGKTRPMRVKVGDIVEFSPRNQIEWDFEGEELVWVWEQACYGTTNDSKHEALLWQQSAGYDRHGNWLGGTG
jgi:co-chaperonin GroES (HSP10)